MSSVRALVDELGLFQKRRRTDHASRDRGELGQFIPDELMPCGTCAREQVPRR